MLNAKSELFDIALAREQARLSAERELQDIEIGRRRAMARVTAIGAANGAANLDRILTDASSDYRAAKTRVARDASVTDQTLRLRAGNVRGAARDGGQTTVIGGLLGAVGSGANAYGVLSQ